MLINKKSNVIFILYASSFLYSSNLLAMQKSQTLVIKDVSRGEMCYLKELNLDIHNAKVNGSISGCNDIFAKQSTFYKNISTAGKVSIHECTFHNAPIIEAYNFFSLYDSDFLAPSNGNNSEVQITLRKTTQNKNSVISLNIENTTFPITIPLKIFLNDNATLFFYDQNIYNDIFITIVHGKRLHITFQRCAIKGNVYVYQEEADEKTHGVAAIKLKYSQVLGGFHFSGYKSYDYSIEKLIRN